MPDPHRSEALGARTLQRVYSEFLEMPGLRLTLPQAQRLWSLDADSCRLVLEALVDARFLEPPDAGVYKRPGARRPVARTSRRSTLPSTGER